MRTVSLCLVLLFIGATSCTKDKTDYEAEIDITVPEYEDFEEVASVSVGDYAISIEALNGTFYKGYNGIRLKITGGQPPINDVSLLPILTDADGGMDSCPHRSELVYMSEEGYFSGYVVFTSASGTDGNWEFYIDFTANGQVHSAVQYVEVTEQTNKNLNMVTFIGNDDKQYIVALVAPQQPRVGENDLVAGIYQRYEPDDALPVGFPDASRFSYREVSSYTLLLDPRMPEPSMGNHSSPNNEDLTQNADGLYHGVVNYTMTGNWTLNFILMNENGRIVKGTEVPKDFTPGMEGVKSELHIDILF